MAARTTAQRLADIEQSLSDLEYGVFRAPNGPATIRGQSIKPKTVNAGLINVDDLQSVNSKTGSLSVTGSITMAAGGSFSSGQTAYDTGTGFWLEYNAGIPRFSLGNSGGNKITWNGSVLSITGSITATTGTIGGWVIGTTDLQEAGGTGTVGMASSGSTRFWAGSATPASAPWRVSSAGVMTAVGATIQSGSGSAKVEITSTNGISVYDSGGTVRGRILTDGSGFLGSTDGTSTTAALKWTTAGVSTLNADKIITGTLTFGSGGTVNSTGAMAGTFGGVNLANLTITGTLTMSGSGTIVWDSSGSSITASKMSIKTSAFGTSMEFKDSLGTQRGSIYCYSSGVEYSGATGNAGYYITGSSVLAYHAAGSIEVNGSTTAGLVAGTNASITAGQYVNAVLGDAAGTYQFRVYSSTPSQVFGINSLGDLVRPITNDSTALGAYYGRVPIYINGVLKYLAVYS